MENNIEIYWTIFDEKILSSEVVKIANEELSGPFNLNLNSATKNQKISFFAKLYLQLVAQKNGYSNVLQNFVLADNGKPYQANGSFYFNISHSNSLVAIAIAKNFEVGLDIQKHKKVSDGVVKRICSLEEKSWLEKSNQKESDFFYLWTRKEAAVKTCGEGIKFGLNKFSVLQDQTTLNNQRYFLNSFPLVEDYSGAVCSTAPPSNLVVQRLNF